MLRNFYLRDLVDIIYPNACLGCRQPLVSQEEILCGQCLSELPKTNFHRIKDNEVEKVFIGRCHLKKATSYLYFSKGGIVQAFMHQLKYKGKKEVGSFFGRMIGQELKKDGFFDDLDYLLPIPLHPKKLAKRGYNQSGMLAAGMAETTGLPVLTDNLVRVAHSETQTKKSRFARWLNVESIFEIKDPTALRNRHLLLIDDVITTGATVEASATKLAAIPGVQVSLLTLARAK